MARAGGLGGGAAGAVPAGAAAGRAQAGGAGWLSRLAGRTCALLRGAGPRARRRTGRRSRSTWSATSVATVLDLVTVLVLFRVTRTLGGFTLPEALLIVGLSRVRVRAGRPRRRQHRAAPDLRAHRPAGRGAGAAAGRAGAAGADGPAAAQGSAGWLLGAAVLVVALRLGRHRLDAGPGGAGGASPRSPARSSSARSSWSAPAVAFWWIESGEIGNAFTYGGRDFTSYPITVYGGWFRRRLRVRARASRFVGLLPGAGAARPGRPARPAGLGGLGVARPSRWSRPAAAAAVWRAGVRHYRSTGS